MYSELLEEKLTTYSLTITKWFMLWVSLFKQCQAEHIFQDCTASHLSGVAWVAPISLDAPEDAWQPFCCCLATPAALTMHAKKLQSLSFILLWKELTFIWNPKLYIQIDRCQIHVNSVLILANNLVAWRSQCSSSCACLQGHIGQSYLSSSRVCLFASTGLPFSWFFGMTFVFSEMNLSTIFPFLLNYN